MAIRQEQVVFLGALALLGFLVYGDLSDSAVAPRGGGRRGEPPVFQAHPAPDLSRALGRPRRVDELVRSLFEAPREVRPLPPLPLEPPPLEPLATLVPPPTPGPAPSLHGRFLRASLPRVEEPELFGQDEEFGALLDDDSLGDGLQVDESLLTAEERAQRIDGYKQLYDWIFVGQLRFGQIRNEDRYTLAARPTEPLRFVEFNPATGVERFPGQVPISFARERVEDFGFADTVTNRIELRRLTFGDPLSHGEYEEALAFAEWCVEHRLQSPRALEVAEELFARAQPLAEQDPTPRLGLARCREAAFDFEGAYRIYGELLAGRFERHPVVLARLAELEWRFRLVERALARLREAERYGRTSWQVQWALGRLLLELGRHAEARTHLALAGRHEPSAPEQAPVRADIRTDLGAVHMALGELSEARSWFRQALQAQPDHQGARAGLLGVAYLERRGGSNGASGGLDAALVEFGELEGAQADLLLARGLEALAVGDWFGARDRLLLSAQADPFAAGRAWRALAWLADHTGHGEDGLRFVEAAQENDPTDPYTLYLRGRLLAGRDDLEGAREAWIGALDRELEYPDALAALGRLSFQDGAYEDAERYLERALEIAPDQADWHALRGLNWLNLGRAGEAAGSFEAALAQSRAHPVARNGLAWVHYVRGDPTEAMALFREHDDERRAQAEDDPHRVYARRQIERIVDHIEKVVWSDRFEREELRGGWIVDEGFGPTHRMLDGAVLLEGDFRGAGRARVWRSRNAADFVSFEAHVTVLAGTSARVGVFLSKERAPRGGGLASEIQTEVTGSRHREGALQTRFSQRQGDDAPYADVTILDWPVGQTRVVRIERSGSAADTRLRVVVDGIPVGEAAMPNMGRTNDDLRMGVFAEGEPGRSVRLRLEQVDQVFRQR